MKRDHSDIEALFAVRALGGLDAAGEESIARERADHGQDCDECYRLQDTYAETAGALAFALDPVPLREGLEDAVLRRATAAERGAKQPLRSGGVARGLVAAAVAALLLVGGAAGYLLGGSGSSTDAQALQPLLAERGARVDRLGGSGEGNLAIAYRPGGEKAFLIGTDLSSPPDGKTYELWRIRGKKPIASGCFAPQGGGSLLMSVPSPASADVVAVTIEPTCGSAPTQTPVFSETD